MGGILGGATVWKGTVFDCPLNEIALLHSRFINGTFGVCNNGAIVARSLLVEGNNTTYTSQLNVTVTSDMAGETIMCVHDIYISSNIIQLSAVIPTTGNNIIIRFLLVVNVVKLFI